MASPSSGTGNLAPRAIVTSDLPTAGALTTLAVSGNATVGGTLGITGAVTATGGIKIIVTVVASLPTCSGNEGTLRGVTDATITTFHSVVAGGGANHVKVYCNGTNWVIGG